MSLSIPLNGIALIDFGAEDYERAEEVMFRMANDASEDECSTTVCESELGSDDEWSMNEDDGANMSTDVANDGEDANGAEQPAGRDCGRRSEERNDEEAADEGDEKETMNFVYVNGEDCEGIDSVGDATDSDEREGTEGGGSDRFAGTEGPNSDLEEFDDTEEDQVQLRKIISDMQGEMTKRCIPAAYATADGLYRVSKSNPTDKRALFDVIIGKGPGHRRNVGNQLLLEHLRDMKKIWQGIWTHDRRAYAERMVQWVYRRGGRFFKYNRDSQTYDVASDKEACREIHHILQSNTSVRRKMIVPSKKGGWILKNEPANGRRNVNRTHLGLLDAALVLAYKHEDKKFSARQSNSSSSSSSNTSVGTGTAATTAAAVVDEEE